MIIFNAAVFELFMVSLSIGMAALQAKGNLAAKARWNKVFKPLERITILVLFAQETLISFMYVWAAYRYLKNRSSSAARGKVTKAMTLLLGVQIVVLLIDVALISVDFLGLNTLKLFINSFVYAIKLELEFLVLNQLVEISRLGVTGIRSASNAIRFSQARQGGESEAPDFITAANLDKWASEDTLRITSAGSDHSKSSTRRPSIAQAGSALEKIPEGTPVDGKLYTIHSIQRKEGVE